MQPHGARIAALGPGKGPLHPRAALSVRAGDAFLERPAGGQEDIGFTLALKQRQHDCGADRGLTDAVGRGDQGVDLGP